MMMETLSNIKKTYKMLSDENKRKARVILHEKSGRAKSTIFQHWLINDQVPKEFEQMAQNTMDNLLETQNKKL